MQSLKEKGWQRTFNDVIKPQLVVSRGNWVLSTNYDQTRQFTEVCKLRLVSNVRKFDVCIREVINLFLTHVPQFTECHSSINLLDKFVRTRNKKKWYIQDVALNKSVYFDNPFFFLVFNAAHAGTWNWKMKVTLQHVRHSKEVASVLLEWFINDKRGFTSIWVVNRIKKVLSTRWNVSNFSTWLGTSLTSF